MNLDNSRDALERQLKSDLLRQKEAWDIGQKYNDPELQKRAHERAEWARAIAKVALGEIPEGYGANNPISETQAIFNQEYGRQPEYNFQNPPQQRVSTQLTDGKDIANVNFSEGQGQRKAQFNDFQSRKIGEEIVGLKQQWNALEGLIQQHNAILNNPTTTQEMKQYAQQQIDAARQSQMQINQQAEQMRTRASGLGVNLNGYGSGNTVSESETNLGFELDKAIRSMFVDQYSRNSADYYNRRYQDYLEQGLSKRHAREKADADATRYQYDRMRVAKDLFMNIGMKGGQLTDYGMALAQIMSEEGDPSAAELWKNGYATPYQAWGKDQERINAAIEHGYSGDTAENNLRRQLAMLMAGLDVDLTKMDQNQRNKLAQMTLAGDIDYRNGIAKIVEQGKINSAEADRKRAFEQQKLEQQYRQKFDEINQTYKLKMNLEQFKQSFNSQKIKTAFDVYQALGKSPEEAWLLANGYSVDPAKNEKMTDDKKLEYRCDNYMNQIEEMLDAGNEEGARAVIDAAREFMDSEAGLESDSEAMKELRIILREYEQRMSKNSRTQTDKPPKNPVDESTEEQDEEALNENRWENLTDRDFASGQSTNGYTTKVPWIKNW